MAIRSLSHRKPPEMAVTALFCDESNADASGCMNMHVFKFYQPWQGRFIGWFVALYT